MDAEVNSVSKGLFDFKTLASIAIIVLLMGPFALSLGEDFVYIFICTFSKGCNIGNSVGIFWDDIRAVITLGNSQVKDGVDGLLELQQESALTAIQKRTLAQTYRDNIIKGSFLTIGFVALIFWLLNKYHYGTTQWEPPKILGIMIAITFAAIIQVFASGFSEIPFSGMWHLASNYHVMSSEFLQIISPIPIEAIGVR